MRLELATNGLGKSAALPTELPTQQGGAIIRRAPGAVKPQPIASCCAGEAVLELQRDQSSGCNGCQGQEGTQGQGRDSANPLAYGATEGSDPAEAG